MQKTIISRHLSFGLQSKIKSFSTPLQLIRRISDISQNTLIDPSLGLNEEQRLLQDTALKFALTELRPNMMKWDATHYFAVDQIKAAAQLGFAAMYTPIEHGGSGLSRLDTSIIMEALSQGCVGTAALISIHNMCVWIISQFGDDEQRQRLLPQLVNMDKMASYCLTEPGSGSDAASLSTTAKRKGDDYVLNGTKAFISGAGESDFYLIMCRTGQAGSKGISCLIVEKDSPGLSFGKIEDKLGWNCSPTRMVHLEQCHVPVRNRLGEEGDGFKIAMKGINGGRVNISSCSLGAAQHAMEETLRYVQERRQFNTRIADFQNTQFKLAEYATDLLSSRLAVRAAASALDAVAGSSDSESAAQAAVMSAAGKLLSTERCYQLIDGCLQLFGGYGYLKDYPLQQLLRDSRVNRILEGTNEVMRMIIAKQLLKN